MMEARPGGSCWVMIEVVPLRLPPEGAVIDQPRAAPWCCRGETGHNNELPHRGPNNPAQGATLGTWINEEMKNAFQ